MKNLGKIGLISVAVLAFVIAIGVPLYQTVTYVEQDLAPLEPYAETENIDALVQRIQRQPVPEDGFSFVVLGDTRSNFFKAREVLTQAASHGPAFILSNGDLVRHGTVEEFIDHHLRLIKEIEPIPYVPVPGNHERGPNYDFAAYKAIYGALEFSFDYGGCRFIGLNNGDRFKLSGSDIRFLENELTKPAAKHKFVLFHLPPTFLENAVESEDTRGFTWNAERMHKIMREHNVDHVFAGHVHGFATENFDGVQYTITGGAGANLTDKLGEEGNVYNYVLVEVGPDGVTSTVYKEIAGEWVAEEIA